jgi:predicted O-methyltransferase YrrM
MTFEETLANVEEQAKTLVWWSPDQLARGENLINNPTKGQRAWSIPRETGEFLHTLISDRKPLVILELGTSIGYSTLWLAHAAAQYGGHVHTIERQGHKFEIAQDNIKNAELTSSVSFYRGEIIDILKGFEKVFEKDYVGMVFMDADRGHYHEYFPLLKPHLKADALIIADNALNMNKRMQPFLDLLENEGWHYEIKDLDNGLLVASFY